MKIDKEVVQIGPQVLSLIAWDLYGEDAFQQVRMTYLRGASGYFLVVDGTRRATLARVLPLQQSAEEAFGKVPSVLVFNKADLTDEWDIDAAAVAELAKKGWSTIRASAKTGRRVEEAFATLAQKMLVV